MKEETEQKKDHLNKTNKIKGKRKSLIFQQMIVKDPKS